MKSENTKEKIASTLYEILQTNRIQDITVTDIVKSCRVSKRTFYNYYSDKFDAVFYIFDRIEEDYYSKYDNGLVAALMLEDFENNLYLFTHKNFFKNNLCYTSQNNLMDYIISKWNKVIVKEFNVDITEELSIAINVFCYGMISFIYAMLRGDIAMPANLTTPLTSLCIPQKLYEMVSELNLQASADTNPNRLVN